MILDQRGQLDQAEQIARLLDRPGLQDPQDPQGQLDLPGRKVIPEIQGQLDRPEPIAL